MKRDDSLYPIPVVFTCLLPRISDVATILGHHPTLPWVLQRLSSQAELPVPVDRKTAALGPRMSPGSLSKVLRFLSLGFERMGVDAPEEMLDMEGALPGDESPSAMEWRALVASLRALPGTPFPTVCAYAERMCDRERELVRFALAHPNDVLGLLDRYRETLEELTAIPGPCLQAGFAQVAAALRQGVPRPQTPETLALDTWMHWDSILRLAAVAEIDLFDAQSGSETEASTAPGSVLERLWPVWKDGVVVNRPPRRFFDLVRRAVRGRPGLPTPLSWGILAEKMPALRSCAGDTQDAKRDPENQRRELVRWRRGGHRPAPEKLSRFLRNLGANEGQIVDMLILCRIAYGIDREVQQAIKRCDGPPSTASRLLPEVFATYPRYRIAARAYGAVG